MGHLQAALPLDCGSNGGTPHGTGTFGFVGADHGSRAILAAGKGSVPGYIDEMSSTWAELCGIFAALTYLQLVKQYCHIVMPKTETLCTLYCDSKSTLLRISDISYDAFGTTWQCRTNYDFESAIQACLKGQNWNSSWMWVKGHASRRKRGKTSRGQRY